MVMEGIVRGEMTRKKPVVDGIVCGVEKPKKMDPAPDTISVSASATRLGQDTFGSGLTPQGMGNMGKASGKGMKGKGKMSY